MAVIRWEDLEMAETEAWGEHSPSVLFTTDTVTTSGRDVFLWKYQQTLRTSTSSNRNTNSSHVTRAQQGFCIKPYKCLSVMEGKYQTFSRNYNTLGIGQSRACTAKDMSGVNTSLLTPKNPTDHLFISLPFLHVYHFPHHHLPKRSRFNQVSTRHKSCKACLGTIKFPHDTSHGDETGREESWFARIFCAALG